MRNPRNQHHRIQVTLTPVRVSGRLHGSCFPVSLVRVGELFVRLSGALGSALTIRSPAAAVDLGAKATSSCGGYQ